MCGVGGEGEERDVGHYRVRLCKVERTLCHPTGSRQGGGRDPTRSQPQWAVFPAVKRVIGVKENPFGGRCPTENTTRSSKSPVPYRPS